MRDEREVVRLLHRIGTQHREAGRARRHHIAMVAEDRKRMRRDGARRDVDDTRSQLASDLVHVGDHQEQALRGGEGGAERTRLQRAMERAGRAALALHLDDFRHGAEDVLAARVAPLIGQLAHRRRWRDGVDRDYFAQAVGNRGRRFISVKNFHNARSNRQLTLNGFSSQSSEAPRRSTVDPFSASADRIAG